MGHTMKVITQYTEVPATALRVGDTVRTTGVIWTIEVITTTSTLIVATGHDVHGTQFALHRKLHQNVTLVKQVR